MDGSCFVRISRAIVDMEIIPAAIDRKLGGGFVACTNCRAQTLDVVLGCSPQRVRHQFDEGIEPRGKAPADLLMNTEDDVMVGRIDKPYPENIANAACQYKIVIPFATAQYRIRDTLGEFLPASIEQRRVWVEGGVVLDIVGFEFGAEAGKTGLFHMFRALVRNDQGRAGDAGRLRQRLERIGPRLPRSRGILERQNKSGHANRTLMTRLEEVSEPATSLRMRRQSPAGMSKRLCSHHGEILDVPLIFVKVMERGDEEDRHHYFAAPVSADPRLTPWDRVMLITICRLYDSYADAK